MLLLEQGEIYSNSFECKSKQKQGIGEHDAGKDWRQQRSRLQRMRELDSITDLNEHEFEQIWEIVKG